jgi:hypothetical protein
MFTMVTQSTRKTVSAVAAIAIVSFGGLVMDQAHLAAAPRGTVEVGELTLVDNGQLTQVMLPEVVVLAKRESATFLAAATQLPEIVVVAKRVAHMVANSDGKAQPSSAMNAGAEGALLK